VSLEPGHDEEGRKELETNVVPAVKQAPGVRRILDAGPGG
jgi:hypothetical protein